MAPPPGTLWQARGVHPPPAPSGAVIPVESRRHVNHRLPPCLPSPTSPRVLRGELLTGLQKKGDIVQNPEDWAKLDQLGMWSSPVKTCSQVQNPGRRLFPEIYGGIQLSFWAVPGHLCVASPVRDAVIASAPWPSSKGHVVILTYEKKINPASDLGRVVSSTLRCHWPMAAGQRSEA